jgi:hypothetical protein
VAHGSSFALLGGRFFEVAGTIAQSDEGRKRRRILKVSAAASLFTEFIAAVGGFARGCGGSMSAAAARAVES